jgi:hypothetical protein
VVPPASYSNKEKHTYSNEQVCGVVLVSHLAYTAFKTKQYLEVGKVKDV